MRTRKKELEIILQSLHRTGRLKTIYKAYVIHSIKHFEQLEERRDYLTAHDRMRLEACHEILETYCTYLKHSHLRLVS